MNPLQDTYIRDIDILTHFPLLQNVDLHGNVINNLAPLSALPYLMDINVSSNRLTEVRATLLPHPSNPTRMCPSGIAV